MAPSAFDTYVVPPRLTAELYWSLGDIHGVCAVACGRPGAGTTARSASWFSFGRGIAPRKLLGSNEGSAGAPFSPAEEAAVSTYDHYTTPVAPGTWDVPSTGAARFSWEYDDGRERLLDLYQRGKDKQWDAAKRIDWTLPVDTANVMGTGPELNPIYGSRQYEILSEAERDELSHHLSGWLFSQFLHGEQGALTVAARIVESVPDMDSKFYAATQTMDEARHVELYQRFIRDKIGLYYPMNEDLGRLLADALSDSRWDLPYLGMQVLIEGLALAAFGVHRDMANNALVTQLLAYVMQDEARHVAFGRLALRDYYAELTQ